MRGEQRAQAQVWTLECWAATSLRHEADNRRKQAKQFGDKAERLAAQNGYDLDKLAGR